MTRRAWASLRCGSPRPVRRDGAAAAVRAAAEGRAGHLDLGSGGGLAFVIVLIDERLETLLFCYFLPIDGHFARRFDADACTVAFERNESDHDIGANVDGLTRSSHED